MWLIAVPWIVFAIGIATLLGLITLTHGRRSAQTACIARVRQPRDPAPSDERTPP